MSDHPAAPEPARAPGQPEWLAAVEAAIGDGERVVMAMPVLPPGANRSRGNAVILLIPLVVLARRREQKRARAATSAGLGLALDEQALLVVTDRRLLFWSVTSIGNGVRHPERIIGQLDRAQVVSLTNNTAGAGWRTCRFVLDSDVEVELRVPAQNVARLIEAFAPENT